jgi:hypothetical protein
MAFFSSMAPEGGEVYDERLIVDHHTLDDHIIVLPTSDLPYLTLQLGLLQVSLFF